VRVSLKTLAKSTTGNQAIAASTKSCIARQGVLLHLTALKRALGTARNTEKPVVHTAQLVRYCIAP
jgi:hypothetical protein